MEERVQGEVVNPTPEVAWRDDEIGRLARAAGGTLDPNVPPDPTAVPPLIDALAGAGHHHAADALWQWTVRVTFQYDSVHSEYAEQWSRTFNNDWGHLTRDLYSCAAVMAGRVAESLKPVPEPVRTTTDTYRVQLAVGQCRVGRRVRYHDGTSDRSGIVARVLADRWCDIVPTDYEDEPEDAGGIPATYPGGLG